jgi:hypothetical protein
MTKTFTAEEFSNRPLQVYREADKGNKVTINHSRYPDVIFELTARPRRANLGDEELVNVGNDCYTGEGVAEYAKGFKDD